MGIAGDLAAKEEAAFKQLLVVNSLRGVDSTGVAVVNKHTQEVKIRKSVGDVYQLLDANKFGTVFSGVNKLCIGHNRWGTIGGITRKNAHPFEFENVVGVHNGTLKSKYKLPNHNEFDTDSEALYSHINNVGIHKAIETVDGAYALVWYNKEDDTLNMLRNKERPLFYAFTKGKKQLVYASEPWMIEGICWREKIELEEMRLLPEDQLHTFNLTIPVGSVMGEAEVSECKPLPFPVLPVATTTHTTTVKGGAVGGTSGGSKILRIPFEKKASNSSETGLPNFGLLKGLKAISHGRNANGAAYVSFNTNDHPDIEYRLHKGSTLECMEILDDKDSMWMAELTFLSYEMGKPIGRLKCSTFQKDPRSPAKEVPDEENCDDLLYDHQGKVISLKEFKDRYSTCSYCSANIDTPDLYYPLSHNEVLCEDCARSPQCADFIKGCKTSCGC